MLCKEGCSELSIRKILKCGAAAVLAVLLCCTLYVYHAMSLDDEDTMKDPEFTEFDQIKEPPSDDIDIHFNRVVHIDMRQVEPDEDIEIPNTYEGYVEETNTTFVFVSEDGTKYTVNQDMPKFSGNVQEFIDFMGPYAVKLWRERQILPSLTLAQAIIESGSGKSSIGWNLGGVKACCQTGGITDTFSYSLNGYIQTAGYCTNHPSKIKTHLWTREERNGVSQREKHWFAYYRSVNEFLDARYKLLTNGYYPGVIGESDYVEATRKMKNYATTSGYPEMLQDLIENYNLTDWDPGGKLYEGR